MVRQLRGGTVRNGLVLANGGFLTYQHAICLSTKPRRNGSRYPDSRSGTSNNDKHIPEIDAIAEGEAVIEVRLLHFIFSLTMLTDEQTYTVEFGRNGQPSRAYIIGRLERNSHRFLANEGDQQTLSWLASSVEEPIGKQGYVKPQGDRGKHEGNRFFAGLGPSL